MPRKAKYLLAYVQKRQSILNQYLVDHRQLKLTHESEKKTIAPNDKFAVLDMLKRQALESLTLSKEMSRQLILLDDEFKNSQFKADFISSNK